MKEGPSVAIIPCYNAKLFCEKVIGEALPFVDSLILVDDGSTDGTDKILQEFVRLYPAKVHLITFAHNRGKGHALLAAMHYAVKNLRFNALVTVDADGQHNPKDIPRLIKDVQHGADLVIGTRKFSKMPFRSKFANTFILRALKLAYRNAPYDTQSGFRVFGSDFTKEIDQRVEGGRYEMEFSCLLLALEKGRKIVEHPIETVYIDKNRSSHFGVLRDSFRILKVLWQHRKSGRWHGEK